MNPVKLSVSQVRNLPREHRLSCFIVLTMYVACREIRSIRFNINQSIKNYEVRQLLP
jgi:hypothetical protein